MTEACENCGVNFIPPYEPHFGLCMECLPVFLRGRMLPFKVNCVDC